MRLPTPWLLVLALVAAGCDAPAEPPASTAIPEPTSTSTTLPPATTTTQPPPFVYRVGLVGDIVTDNFWAYYAPRSSPSTQYVLGSTKPALYTYDYPGLELAPELAAAGPVPQPVETEDGTWTVTVNLRPGLAWSDGAPLTADDIVFTYETVRDLGLDQGWLTAYPVVDRDSSAPGLVGVSADTPDQVTFIFNQRPGVPIWPHGPGTAPIMPKHFWETQVEAARSASDSASVLYAEPGAGEPSGGPIVITDRTAGRFIEAGPNPEYARTGEEVTSGGITYTIGPFFSEMTFEIYPDQTTAAEALGDGEVDTVLAATGLDRPLAEFADAQPGVRLIENPTNSFRYLGFNLRRPPMNEKAFRDALGLMIDREFLAEQVLQGRGFPVYSTIPAANTKWYDPDQAEGLAAQYAGKSSEQRLDEAVALLEAAGFGWIERPRFENNAVIDGVGATFRGEPVPPLEILAPGAGFDPLRATAALWVGTWVSQLGFEVETRLTDFTSLVDQVFVPTDDGELDFDMFVLGWRLLNPAMPVHHESFWAAKNDTLINDGNNNTGFDDPRFNGFVEEFNSAATEADALDILWEMERILSDEKPYILLFDTGISEAYRSDSVAYPFVVTLSGIQALNGMPALVAPVR